jgi:hypothetical protein
LNLSQVISWFSACALLNATRTATKRRAEAAAAEKAAREVEEAWQEEVFRRTGVRPAPRGGPAQSTYGPAGRAGAADAAAAAAAAAAADAAAASKGAGGFRRARTAGKPPTPAKQWGWGGGGDGGLGPAEAALDDMVNDEDQEEGDRLGGSGISSSFASFEVGLCRLNQVDPYPIAYNLSNP